MNGVATTHGIDFDPSRTGTCRDAVADRVLEEGLQGERRQSHLLDTVAKRADVDKCFQRAARNRDKALQQFPPTVEWRRDHVLVYDASSSQIRRERFAAFYHYPDVHYAVGVIPTRSGFHVMAGENPWNPPPVQVHIGEIMERYGGGGHSAAGTCQVAPDQVETVIAELLPDMQACEDDEG